MHELTSRAVETRLGYGNVSGRREPRKESLSDVRSRIGRWKDSVQSVQKTRKNMYWRMIG